MITQSDLYQAARYAKGKMPPLLRALTPLSIIMLVIQIAIAIYKAWESRDGAAPATMLRSGYSELSDGDLAEIQRTFGRGRS